MGSFNEKGNGMTYTLSIPIDAPTMSRAQAIAWGVLRLLPTGTAFAIKATPAAGGGSSARADGTPWTPAELRDIAEGVVSASLRNDEEVVAAVKSKAEGKAQ